MSILLIHAHLIIDNYKEYLDGALLIEEKTIKEVFVNSNISASADKIIDLKGKIVMPDFYRGKQNKIIVDPLNFDKTNINLDTKIFIGNTKAYAKDVTIDYDGITNLFINMTGFDHKNLGLVNLAFNNLDKYVELDPSLIDKSVLKFTINNLNSERIILIGNKEENIKLLRSVNYPLTSILSVSSLNEYKLYNQDKLNGSLVKGKFADLLVLDEDMNIIERINKGELINAWVYIKDISIFSFICCFNVWA